MIINFASIMYLINLIGDGIQEMIIIYKSIMYPINLIDEGIWGIIWQNERYQLADDPDDPEILDLETNWFLYKNKFPCLDEQNTTFQKRYIWWLTPVW